METKTTPVHPLLVGTTPGPWTTSQVIYDNYPTITVHAPFYCEAVHCRKPKAGHTKGERDQQNADAKLIAQAPSLAAENALLAEQVERLMVETERMRDALYELADAVLWSLDDADYKAPEQFTKSYVFGRYLNRMAQIARAAKELHPMPSPL